MFKIRYLFLIIITTIFISACVSSSGKVVFDSDLPPEKTTKVIFTQEIFVNSYNGIDVYNVWYKDYYLKNIYATLPAGETVVNFHLRASILTSMNSTTQIKMDNVDLRFNFEPEKEYVVGVYSEVTGFIPRKIEAGVAIWNDSTLYKEGGGKRSKEDAIKYWTLVKE